MTRFSLHARLGMKSISLVLLVLVLVICFLFIENVAIESYEIESEFEITEHTTRSVLKCNCWGSLKDVTSQSCLILN